MIPPTPPEEIAQLMKFIAEKAKNVTSPMNVTELCRQFPKETGTLMSVNSLAHRIKSHRDRIHEMVEFNTDTKVKMIFALSASIDTGFLAELKKAADVEVDEQQRIIHYKQKDGGLELSGKHSRISMNQGDQRDRSIIQFLVEKSKTTDKPIADIVFLRDFKEKTGCTDSVSALEDRYQRMKRTIYQTPGIDEKTKIKMMFLSNVKLSDETLKELRESADVGVDEKGRITSYKSNDGSLNFEGNREMSSIKKSFYSDRWKNICQNIDNDESEENGKEVSNWQKGYEKKRIDLIRFLIERTKNVISPLSINNLAKDYKTEFKSSDNVLTIESRIRSFRQRIHTMNQLDIQTKVKMAFALSASIDADFLKELQKDAIVELDGKQRIEEYKANDLGLNLEGDHCVSAKMRSGHAERKKKKARIFNYSSHSKDSDFDISQSPAAVPKRRKRAREDDGEPLKLEDDWSMNFDTNNEDNFDFDPPSYELDMDHLPVEKKPESLIEVKAEEPEMSSTSISGDRYFFDYDPPTYEEDMDHIPAEMKPENLIEVKTEEPDGPSTSSSEYHYEANLEHILTEPKPEIFNASQ